LTVAKYSNHAIETLAGGGSTPTTPRLRHAPGILTRGSTSDSSFRLHPSCFGLWDLTPVERTDKVVNKSVFPLKVYLEQGRPARVARGIRGRIFIP
jgi:hypothetical protein